jgi:hypothetical protein
MFLDWTLSNDADLPAVAGVVARMRDRGFIRANSVDQRLIEGLVTAGDFGPAMLLRRNYGSAREGSVADPYFGEPSAHYPFGWGLVSDGSLDSERALTAAGPALAYRAGPARNGQVAAQLLGLTPGRYALVTRTASTAAGEAPYWSVTCAETGGAQLVKLDQPLAVNAKAAATFEVPQRCAAQWLTLRIRPSADSTPQSGAIAWVSVVPR